MDVISNDPLEFTINDEFNKENRFDVEFYHPKYLSVIDKLNQNKYTTNLGNIITILTDMGAFSLYNVDHFVDEGIPFLRVNNIKRNHLDLSNLKYISEEYHQKLKKSQLCPGDVLLTTKGTIGISAVVPEDIGKVNMSQNLVRMQFKDGIYPEYVSIFLNSELGRLQTERLSTGVTQKYLNFENIKSIRIPILPKDKQGEIVNLLKSNEKKLSSNNNKINCLRNKLNVSISEELGLNISYAGENIFYVEELEKRFDPYYYLPKYKTIFDALFKKDFNLKKLKNLGEFNRALIKPKEEPDKNFKYIQIQDIDEVSHEIISYTDVIGEESPGRARLLIKKGDILIPLLGGSLKSIAIVPDEFDNEVATNGFTSLYIPDEPLRHYVFLFLISEFGQVQMEREKTGAIMPSISKSTVQNLIIPLPNENIIKKIHNKYIKNTIEIKFFIHNNIKIEEKTNEMIINKILGI